MRLEREDSSRDQALHTQKQKEVSATVPNMRDKPEGISNLG